ncbi:MAG: gamma-glutamyl-gamma-aminobutyrate hydrolase family protein [Chloroflexota bacterium]
MCYTIPIQTLFEEVVVPMSVELPKIGLLCRHDHSSNYRRKPVYAAGESYIHALSEGGGLPFLIPLNLPELSLRTLYDLADGIMLTGGGDVEPSLYHHPPHPTQGDVQPDRDRDEMTVARWAAAEGKPLLGICRGIQVMAVAAGGELWQDVPSQLPEASLHHDAYNNKNSSPEHYLAHAVELVPACRLAQIVGSHTIWTNSLHHQAVKRVPEPFRVTGRAADGVVEVIEHAAHPFYIGVQWHPEVLTGQYESARQIFKAFVEACQRK